ncbi:MULTISPECIES: ATP-binding protein [Janibacter]|uniref:ATP-binding protein n=1 Tax=Janibacter melonis TaxID=262209 RepID=A0A5P8FHX4_9MICO|nr:ATP-binding protein [Janibacter melonis]MCB5992042.1 ATP-binding protein [Janibacter melonis]MCM3556742.1 ATP-binding protein [Janibacter melonis]QFQ29066.2 ATP-binding protein [Janibacter melonis]
MSEPAQDDARELLNEFGAQPGDGHARTIRAQWDRDILPPIRAALMEDLQARGMSEEIIDEAEIVVTELVTNALRHGSPLPDRCVRVHWKVRGEVCEVEVSDGGGHTAPKPVPPALWATSGRGLRIVRSLAHEWGVSEDEKRITVWASLGGPSRRRVGS